MIGKLLEAIVDAYRSEEKLAMFLRIKLDKRFGDITWANTYELPVVVFKLIEKSEREGWLPDLIQAQDVERSGNRKVATFYQTYHSLVKEHEIGVPTEPMVFEKDRLTISLQGLMGSETGWGHERGASGAEIIRSSIEASHTLIVRLSLQGIERMDVTYAGELVRLARQERMRRGFCLVDLTDQDLLANWHAAAQNQCQPFGVWNDGALLRQLGPIPRIGLREMLEHVQGRQVSRTSEAATALHLNVPNASNKLKQLWMEGFILRQEQSAGSGGIEYEYLRIG
jgi:hypothetical protein